MTQTTATCLWNDSADVDELRLAIEHGAVGATCNPVIAHTVLKARLAEWRPRIAALVQPDAHGHRGRDRLGGGRTSVGRRRGAAAAGVRRAQRAERPAVDSDRPAPLPRSRRPFSSRRERFDALAPNMIVKIPATRAGIRAIEEATARGHQHQRHRLVHAAAMRGRGRSRRARADTPRGRAATTSARMGPVCTIMVGRLDDWLKVVMDKREHQHRPRPSRMGGRRGVQEDVSALSASAATAPAAVGRVSQPHALERARSAATS